MKTTGNRYQHGRAIVLGGAGFIGSSVSRALVAEGAEVYRVVRPNGSGRAGTGVVEADICDYGRLREVYRSILPSVTFNLAGYGVDPGERDERTAREVNAHAVETICRAAAEWHDREWPGQTVVHVGSALEYGEAGGALPEHTIPFPTTMYGITKLAGTRTVERWSGAIKAAVARLFTVYGPGEHAGRLLPALIDAGRTGEALPLTGGRQMRDFTYVEDVSEGLLRLGLCRNRGVGVVNLATGRLTEVREFVLTAARLLGIPEENLKFGALPGRPEEMRHEPVSLSKAASLLAWRPSTTIADGITKTLAYSTRGECSYALETLPSR